MWHVFTFCLSWPLSVRTCPSAPVGAGARSPPSTRVLAACVFSLSLSSLECSRRLSAVSLSCVLLCVRPFLCFVRMLCGGGVGCPARVLPLMGVVSLCIVVVCPFVVCFCACVLPSLFRAGAATVPPRTARVRVCLRVCVCCASVPLLFAACPCMSVWHAATCPRSVWHCVV